VLVNLATTPPVAAPTTATEIVTVPAVTGALPTAIAVIVAASGRIVSLITESDTGAANAGGRMEASRLRMLTQTKVMIGLLPAVMTAPASALVAVEVTAVIAMDVVETSTAAVVALVPVPHAEMVIAIVLAETMAAIALETAAPVPTMTAEAVQPVATPRRPRSPRKTIVTSAPSSCSKSRLVLRPATSGNSSSLIVVQSSKLRL
jgi:hypothetical protein